jgi:hypothetical protein
MNVRFKLVLKTYVENIDAHGLKIQEEGPWDILPNLFAEMIFRGCNSIWGRVHLFSFIAILLTGFSEKFGGMVLFHNPCVHLWLKNSIISLVTNLTHPYFTLSYIANSNLPNLA